jgi:hypothetical protein
MKKQAGKNPPVDAKGSNDQHKDYLRSIVADFDDEKVYVSDIKKLIKWYHILEAQNLLTEDEAEATAEVAEVDAPAAEKKPAKKKKAKEGEATDKEGGANE